MGIVFYGECSDLAPFLFLKKLKKSVCVSVSVSLSPIYSTGVKKYLYMPIY